MSRKNDTKELRKMIDELKEEVKELKATLNMVLNMLIERDLELIESEEEESHLTEQGKITGRNFLT
jgi:hypothetical protein